MRDIERLKGHNLEELLSILDDEFDVDSKGRLSTGNMGASEAFSAVAVTLLTQKKFNPQLSEIDRYDLIKAAIRDTLASGELNAARLRGELHRAERARLKQEAQLFTVATSLSTPFTKEIARRSVGKCRITLAKELPHRYRHDHHRLVDDHWTVNNVRTPDVYSAVRVTCSATTPHAAMDKALDAINFLRGIWNWARNRSVIRLGRSPWMPLNDLVLGPFHTCHYNDGNLASNTLWYEDYALAVMPTPSELLPLTRLLDAEEKVRKIVKRSPQRERLMQIFNRYVRALDSYSSSIQFIRLWSLLEYLAVVGEKEGNDKIVRRGSFPLPQGADREQELEALAVFRNEVIHEAVESNYVGPRVTQLRRIVEHLIAVWLGPCSQLDTLADVRSFLDLPRENGSLKTHMNRLQAQIQLQGKLLSFLTP